MREASTGPRDRSYREWLPRSELRRHVAAVWLERSRPDGTPHRDRVLPDGCIDIVYGRNLWVRGPETEARAVRYPADSTFVGFRFRPGAAAAVLGAPASELVDRRVPLDALWGSAADELVETLAAAPSLIGVVERLEAAIVTRARQAPPDPLIEAVARRVASVPASVASLAEAFGVSERQLRRRCHCGLGYGAKTLARIARFQRFRALAEHDRGLGLAALAASAGYSDQPHLTRECRRLAGETPRAHLTRVRSQ